MRQGHSVTAKRLKGTHRPPGHCHVPDQAGRIFLQDCPHRGRHANPAVRQRAESECPLTEKKCRWLIVCEWQELAESVSTACRAGTASYAALTSFDSR